MVKLNVKDIINQHNRFKARFWGYGSWKLYNIEKEFKSHYSFHFHFSTSKLPFSPLFWHTKVFCSIHFHSSKQDVIFKLKS